MGLVLLVPQFERLLHVEKFACSEKSRPCLCLLRRQHYLADDFGDCKDGYVGSGLDELG